MDNWNNISDFLQYWFDNNELADEDQRVFEKYYEKYRKDFNPYLRHHFAQQTLEIGNSIRRKRAPRLLEIGTGCGTEALWFALLGAEVTTIDLKPERLAVARARRDWLERKIGRSLNIKFVEASIFEFQSEALFDLVWMEQAYHHIEPREELAPLLFKLLGPNGECHISEANAWNPMLQAQLFSIRGFRTKGVFYDNQGKRHPYGDERITTPFALRRTLLKAGFWSAKSRNFRLLPSSNPPLWWLKVEAAILVILPAASTHYNVIGTKK
ncbi:MAG: methyltransferase domain-containing protein [Sphingorhabdus sp.]